MASYLKPISPGEVLLEEFLKPMAISQNSLAEAINVPPNRVNQIVNGKREISVDTSIRLGKFFGMSPMFWLNLQNTYNFQSVSPDRMEAIMGEVVNLKVKI